MGKMMRALGLMSGTSMDGIDVALIETDGEDRVERGPAMTFPYTEELRQLLRAAVVDASYMKSRNERPGSVPHADRELTEVHGAAVSHFLRKRGIDRKSIDVIGFHGHTVLHRSVSHSYVGTTEPRAVLDTPRVVPFVVEGMLTIQLGLGEMLAELTRCPVVYDLRAADVEAGGQGAPLVPVYHRALAAKIPQRPLAIVNIGGVANVTWIGRDDRLVAFDTGPGNALIDDWVRLKTGLNFDDGGALAARGRADDMVVAKYLSDPYFHLLAPKSLDRNAFNLDLVSGLAPEDGAATLSEVTARSIAGSVSLFPALPQLWVICGGGRRNKTLMAKIAGLVENAVVPAEAVGFNGDSLEAEAWAYLAVRSLRGLPISFPDTTGVAHPLTGGVLAKPRQPFST